MESDELSVISHQQSVMLSVKRISTSGRRGSGGEIAANFFGDSESLVDAGTDGGAAQIVAAQPKTWETRAKLGDCGQAVGVTEIVLRKGTRPNCGVCKDRCARDGEQRRDF